MLNIRFERERFFMVQMSEVARQRAAFVASGQADCAPGGHPEVDREIALSMATDDYICLRCWTVAETWHQRKDRLRKERASGAS